MPTKRLGAEQIVKKLRQVEMLQSQGKSVAAACKEADLTLRHALQVESIADRVDSVEPGGGSSETPLLRA